MKNHRAPWTRGTCRRLLALAVSASVVLIGVPASAWATEQIEGSESTVSKVQAPASQTAPTDSSSQADASDNGNGSFGFKFERFRECYNGKYAVDWLWRTNRFVIASFSSLPLRFK